MESIEHFEDCMVRVLDHWQRLGKRVRFWWRDDDATCTGPRLERLLEVTDHAPLAIAVIPNAAQKSLVDRLSLESRVCVFQHGWAHVNHAPRGRGLGAWELDGYRPVADVLAEMEAGKTKLETLFGQQFTPVMVPPWNKIHERLLPGLGAAGFWGVSAMGHTTGSKPAPDLTRIDCVFDVLRWKGEPRFAGWVKATRCLTEALSEPAGDAIVGINTHHRSTDDEGWTFIATLNRVVNEHPASEWVPPQRLFAKP